MYENGRKVSRYYSQVEHKRKMKERFLKDFYGSALNMSYEEYLASLDETCRNYSYGPRKGFMPSCECYWRHGYLTGLRQFAKDTTNRKVRSYYKDQIARCEDWEDWDAIMQRSNLEKMVDYWGIVY